MGNTCSERVIVALDGMPKSTSLELAEKLKDLVWGFKVNDLLVECGISVIQELKSFGGVFADAKLHDIPNTVANGISRLEAAGADLITVHASGGRAMLEAAASSSKNAKILAVTVLTSLGESDSEDIFQKKPGEAVVHLAGIVQQAGVPGIVCSPKELGIISKDPKLSQLFKVIPGIRPKWYGASDDQKRVKSPADAVDEGADLLVIGRPITKHEDPKQAVMLINEEF